MIENKPQLEEQSASYKIQNKLNTIYDVEFVNYINALSDSIKEYSKVTMSNISESSKCLNHFKIVLEQINQIILTMINSNSLNGINEILQKIDIFRQNIENLETNVSSNSESITLFFDDAKFLFKKMKEQRKKNINNLMNNSQKLNTSASPYRKISNVNAKSPYRTNKNNLNNNLQTITNETKILYDDIMNLLKNFGDSLKSSFQLKKKYDDLTNNIKIKLDQISSLINNFRCSGTSNTFYTSNSFTNINQINQQDNRRSNSPMPINKLKFEFDKLKKINKEGEMKINDLQDQITAYKCQIKVLERDLKKTSSEYNFNYVNSDCEQKYDNITNLSQRNINKFGSCSKNQNINLNMTQLIKQKDNEIKIYKNKLNICQNRISALTKELNDLKNNVDGQIMLLQKQNDEKQNEIERLEMILNNNQGYVSGKEYDINKNESKNMGKYNETIANLRNQIMGYKNIINMNENKIAQYENKIRELTLNNSNSNRNNITNKMSQNNSNYINIINKLKKELALKNNQINMVESDRNKLKMELQSYYQGAPVDYTKIIEEQNNNLNILNKELNDCRINQQKNDEMINKYKSEIEELNNHIIDLNKIIEKKDNIINQFNNMKMTSGAPSNINEQLIQENNELKINLNNLSQIDVNNILKENEEYKKQFEELQDKYIKVKMFYDENLAMLKNNFENKNLADEIITYKTALFNTQMEKDRLTKELFEIKNNTNIENYNNNQYNPNNNLPLLQNKIIYNNNNNNDLQMLNMQLSENNQSIQQKNNELTNKIKELTLNIQNLKENLQKEIATKTNFQTEIQKKNEELEGLKTFIKKLEIEREELADAKNTVTESSNSRRQKSMPKKEIKHNTNTEIFTNNTSSSKENKGGDIPLEKYNKLILELNNAEENIVKLQKSNKELQNKLEEKEVQKIMSGYRTEEFNFSNYEEEFDLKKIVSGAKDKNRSEDINIDYPGVQGIKEKQKELLQKLNMLEEQVKILLCNINCSGKIKPTVTQICQLLGLNHQRTQMVISGKDKKKALGIII